MVLDLKKRWRLNDPYAPGKPIPLEEPINIISWSDVADWTDIDINQYISIPGVKFVYLNAELYFIAYASGGPKMSGLFRKKGSTTTTNLPRIVNQIYYGEVFLIGYRQSSFITVGVNDNGIFEAKLQIDNGSPIDINFVVDLIDYSL